MSYMIAGTSNGQVSSERPPGVCRKRVPSSPVAVLSSLLALLATSPLFAQTGLNLSWDDCGTFGTNAKAFACNTNEGSNTLVVSFAVQPEYCVIGHNAVLDLQTSGPTLPGWWQFKNAGSCRLSALSASADFSGLASCQDPWLGSVNWGVAAYQVGLGAPNRARIITSVSTPFPECLQIPSGVEMYAIKLLVSNAMSVGAGSCAGCEDGACIVLNSLQLYQYGGLPIPPAITTPLSRSFVTWQAGIPDCPGATPARNRTWGAIKTLYR